MNPRHACPFLIAAILLAGFPFGVAGQISTPPVEISPTPAERQRATVRDSWWMRGRTAPPGQSPADLRFRAHQFKLRRQSLIARPKPAQDTAVAAAGSGWRALGPAPLASDASGFGLRDYGWVSGRATSVTIDAADVTGNTVYVGGAYGGLWKSSNAAAPLPSSVVWTPLLDDQATLAVGAVAIQPGGTGVILVGTGETNSSTDSYYGLGMLRSTDEGATWTLISASQDGRAFKGMGFSKIAFSSDNPSLVVAAAGFASQGTAAGLDSGGNRGIYASTDGGQTWRLAAIKDGATSITSSSVSSVVYDATSNKFLAAIRRHGIYSSSDGVTWTRLTNQPGFGDGALTTTACPPDAAANLFACPIYRGEIAIVPGRDEAYVWFMDLPGNSPPETDRGIWRSVGGGPWTQISSVGLSSCGDALGCGAENGDYSLAISAVPNGSVATDLYAGAVNLYRCPLTNGNTSVSCSGGGWLNLTHAYGCSEIAKVHPNQHAMQFTVVSGKAIGYFANDGGIYRALDGFTGLGSGLNGSCTGTNQFDSLNETLGSMTQIVSFAQNAASAATLLAGAQGNGFPATNQAGTSSSFVNVLSGDGGYTAISPTSNLWFAATPDLAPGGLNINSCTSGIACRSGSFSTITDSADLGGDDGSYYSPFMLDPQSDGQLLIGTCRVWRAAVDRSAFTQLSNNFDTGSGSCTGDEINQVRALAAGGPKGSHGFSNIVYATTDGGGPLVGPSSPAGGRVFVSTNADGSAPSFTDVTGTINPQQVPVSSVAIDSADATGATAFITIMGFGVTHVFKTTNYGATWAAFASVASGLPDAPVNASLIDRDAGQLYVGTDVGVFVSPMSAPSWTEVGAPSGFGHLPNVPVTALRMFNPTPETKKLRVSTYGRGLWEFSLVVTPDFQISVSNPSVTIFAGQQATLNASATSIDGYTSTVVLSCVGSAQPSTCTPSTPTIVPSDSGTHFTVVAASPPGVYPFNIHGAGADDRHLQRDAGVTLKIVDYAISGLTPAAISVARPNTSAPMSFVVSAAGPFEGVVSLSCPSGLPAGASCVFTPSSSVTPTPVTSVSGTLKIATGTSTPVGSFVVTVQASVPGSPAPKTSVVTLTVTAAPDYAMSISNSPLSLAVGQSGDFIGTLTALNGYGSAVAISCGAGAPGACTGGSFIPTPTGTEFRVNVSGSSAQTYHFDLVGSGTDSATTKHSAPVTLIATADFTISNNSGTQTVNAGGTATYSLDLSPSGGSFPNSVSLNCTSSSLPSLSRCVFEPTAIPAGSGPTTVRLSIATTASTAMLGIPGKTVFFASLFLPLLGLVAAGRDQKVRKSTSQLVALTVVFVCAVSGICFFSACGGGYSDPGHGHEGTPPGSYNVQVSASSGSVSQHLSVTLIVQ